MSAKIPAGAYSGVSLRLQLSKRPDMRVPGGKTNMLCALTSLALAGHCKEVPLAFKLPSTSAQPSRRYFQQAMVRRDESSADSCVLAPEAPLNTVLCVQVWSNCRQPLLMHWRLWQHLHMH